jgi:hypothetical protein
MKDQVLNEEWVEVKEDKPKKKRSAAYSKNKGNAYERQIVNELKELTGSDNISTSRSSSKKLDNMKIDINDEDGIFPCYFQLKKTQTTPSLKKITAEVGKIDKPLCIIWNGQEKKNGNTNITSFGEFAMLPKSLFYDLLTLYINQDKEIEEQPNVDLEQIFEQLEELKQLIKNE